jgi:hypothetical protein
MYDFLRRRFPLADFDTAAEEGRSEKQHGKQHDKQKEEKENAKDQHIVGAEFRLHRHLARTFGAELCRTEADRSALESLSERPVRVERVLRRNGHVLGLEVSLLDDDDNGEGNVEKGTKRTPLIIPVEFVYVNERTPTLRLRDANLGVALGHPHVEHVRRMCEAYLSSPTFSQFNWTPLQHLAWKLAQCFSRRAMHFEVVTQPSYPLRTTIRGTSIPIAWSQQQQQPQEKEMEMAVLSVTIRVERFRMRGAPIYSLTVDVGCRDSQQQEQQDTPFLSLFKQEPREKDRDVDPWRTSMAWFLDWMDRGVFATAAQEEYLNERRASARGGEDGKGGGDGGKRGGEGEKEDEKAHWRTVERPHHLRCLETAALLKDRWLMPLVDGLKKKFPDSRTPPDGFCVMVNEYYVRIGKIARYIDRRMRQLDVTDVTAVGGTLSGAIRTLNVGLISVSTKALDRRPGYLQQLLLHEVIHALNPENLEDDHAGRFQEMADFAGLEARLRN